MRNKFTLVSFLLAALLLLPACSLFAQATKPGSQQCWFDDPTDPDNMILASCKPEVANSQPTTGQPQPATPKPIQPSDNSQPTNLQPATHSIGPLIASGWCVVQSGKSKPASSTVNPTTGNSGTGNPTPGCDIGLGVSLFTHNRLSLVSVLGTKTLGIGLALIVVKPTPSFPRVVALALGLVVQYDSSGIYRQVYPVLGATMSFRGPG